MSKKSGFRGAFEKQHGKRAQARFKSQFFAAFLKCRLISWKVENRDNLKIPIQMEFSLKQKFFSPFSAALLRSSWNYDDFEKKRTLTAFLFSKLRSLKRWLDKSLKSPVPEDTSRNNMVNIPKHDSNLHHNVSIIFIDHCQVNWVGKTPSYWDDNSWDCLITHWLPMKSILFLIERI